MCTEEITGVVINSEYVTNDPSKIDLAAASRQPMEYVSRDRARRLARRTNRSQWGLTPFHRTPLCYPNQSPRNTPRTPELCLRKSRGCGGWPPRTKKTAREASPLYANFNKQVSQTLTRTDSPSRWLPVLGGGGRVGCCRRGWEHLAATYTGIGASSSPAIGYDSRHSQIGYARTHKKTP